MGKVYGPLGHALYETTCYIPYANTRRTRNLPGYKCSWSSTWIMAIGIYQVYQVL